MNKGLFIVPIAQCSANSGSGQRTLHLYRALADSHGIDILLVPEYKSHIMLDLPPSWFQERFPHAERILVVPPDAADTAPSRKSGVFAGVGSFFRRAHNALASRTNTYVASAGAARFLNEVLSQNKYDFVVGRYLPSTSRSGIFETGSAVPVILDVDDREETIVESRIESRTTPLPIRLLLKAQLPEVRSSAQRLMKQCTHLWLASDADVPEVDHASKSVLRNIPYGSSESNVTEMPSDAIGLKTCLFVGTYSHRVNREGVAYFVEKCWPQVRSRVPGARFRIVGSGGWDHMKGQLEKVEGVEVVGMSADLSSEYRNALFSVVPLFEGAGTKIKVLESLRFLRAVVAHTHSMRGFDELVNAQSVLEGSTDQSIAEACIKLFDEPQLARQLALRGSRVVAEHYSYDSFARTVQRDVSLVLNSGKAMRTEVGVRDEAAYAGGRV